MPCPGYMEGNEETQETHLSVVSQILRSLGSLPTSFHFSESVCACWFCYIQGVLVVNMLKLNLKCFLVPTNLYGLERTC